MTKTLVSGLIAACLLCLFACFVRADPESDAKAAVAIASATAARVDALTVRVAALEARCAVAAPTTADASAWVEFAPGRSCHPADLPFFQSYYINGGGYQGGCAGGSCGQSFGGYYGGDFSGGASGGCANGSCGTSGGGRGLFGRRR